MAQYKVPQDVEADDKLLGPFSFRQFVYLLIAGGLIALSVALFQIFPLLAIIPLPFVLLLGALALPLKKDQPMETYLAAIVSYYLKPRTRKWTPGQRDTTITIIAPKKKDDEVRTRDITGEEATHRLSFLADIMDTEGYAIKGNGAKRMDEDLVIEANTTSDMFETNHYDSLESTIARDEDDRHEKVMQEMRAAIDKVEQLSGSVPPEASGGGTGLIDKASPTFGANVKDAAKEPNRDSDTNNVGTSQENRIEDFKPNFDSSVVVAPGSEVVTEAVEKTNLVEKPEKKTKQIMAKPSIIELANNPDYSVATISKEAKRLKERDEGEVFISLH